jgi:hypothetical protein
MAALYKNKSVAEQNLEIAWAVLMSEDFGSFVRPYLPTQSPSIPSVIVNIVLATDIFDKELNDLARRRWDRAFGDNDEVDHDLRATIVIEARSCRLQTCRTRCSIGVYRKWNYKLSRCSRPINRSHGCGYPSLVQGELGFSTTTSFHLRKS